MRQVAGLPRLLGQCQVRVVAAAQRSPGTVDGVQQHPARDRLNLAAVEQVGTRLLVNALLGDEQAVFCHWSTVKPRLAEQGGR
jgi:hypothetical protein